MVGSVTRFKVSGVAVPAATMAMLAVMPIINAGFVTGVSTQLEIPIEYKKQARKEESTNPKGVWIMAATGMKIPWIML